MMKSRLIIILFVILLFTGCNKKEKYIIDNDYLYDIAVQYIIDHDTNPKKSNNRYKKFIDYNGFGITKDKEYRYVYMWIAEGSYYIFKDMIISESGSSMPYKFTFELNKNKVVKYDIPKDGTEYVSSIKEMYPDDIENKAINYQWNDKKLTNEVKDYYSDLKNNNIYIYIEDEFIKLK